MKRDQRLLFSSSKVIRLVICFVNCVTILSMVVMLNSPVSAHSGLIENSKFYKSRFAPILVGALGQDGIENRHWRVAKYRMDENNSANKDELINTKVLADVVFAKGQVYGSSGCGGWMGTYTISGNILISNVTAALAGLCSPDQSAQSYWIEKDLNGERRIEKNNDNIMLRDKNDRAMIMLVPF